MPVYSLRGGVCGKQNTVVLSIYSWLGRGNSLPPQQRAEIFYCHLLCYTKICEKLAKLVCLGRKWNAAVNCCFSAYPQGGGMNLCILLLLSWELSCPASDCLDTVMLKASSWDGQRRAWSYTSEAVRSFANCRSKLGVSECWKKCTTVIIWMLYVLYT